MKVRQNKAKSGKGSRGSYLSKAKRERIKARHNLGESSRKIAKEEHVCQNTVLKTIKEGDVDEYAKALREIKERILAKKQSENGRAKQLFR